MIDITVVISSYRYGHLAAQAVDSVISQTLQPKRIIFVDDGVGDCTHIPTIYPQIEFIERPENLGIVDNFNDILQRVETERCMFLGADNWLRMDALEWLSMPVTDIVSYDIQIVGTEGEKFAKKVAARPWNGGFLWHFRDGATPHGSSLFNVKKAQKIGYKSLSQTNRETQEDKYLFDNMIKQGASHYHVKTPLLYYRRHKENFNHV